MTCGAALILDAAAEAGIRAVWQAAAQAGISSYMLEQAMPPHVTLIGGETLDMAGLREALRRLAAVTLPLAVDFHSLGVFPGAEGVVFLAPNPTRALLDLQAGVWQALSPFMTGVPDIYRPGLWTPHVTLGLGLASGQVSAMINLLSRRPSLSFNPVPRAARLTGVVFGEFDHGALMERVMLGALASQVIIRPVTTADARAYNRLVEGLDNETQFMIAEPGERKLTTWDQRKRLDAVLKTDNQMIFVAENPAGELVGLLGAMGGIYWRNHDTVHLFIGILQAYSGQGLGTRLFETAESWARSWGAHRLELTVLADNLRGLGLYQKMGFVIEGRLRGVMKIDGVYRDEFMMSKLLE